MVCFKICTIAYFWRMQGKKMKLYFALLQLWLFCHLVQMTSAPDLVPGLLCSLFWVLCWCPCFQNIAQHCLMSFHFLLWSFPFCFFFSLSFYSFSILTVLYICQIMRSLTNATNNLISLDVHTFWNNVMLVCFGFVFFFSGWVLMWCSVSIQTYHKDRKYTTLFI